MLGPQLLGVKVFGRGVPLRSARRTSASSKGMKGKRKEGRGGERGLTSRTTHSIRPHSLRVSKSSTSIQQTRRETEKGSALLFGYPTELSEQRFTDPELPELFLHPEARTSDQQRRSKTELRG